MVRHSLLTDSTEDRFSNVQTSSRRIGRTAAAASVISIITLIFLTVLLAVPITILIIGIRYRDPRYCPIEPRISLFLIVHGGVSVGWIVSTILIIMLTVFFAAQRSFVSIILTFILSLLLFLISIFSLVWLIVGSVWTFGVRDRLTHEYDTNNHFYPYNYCDPVLYKFTFIYLIISYVLMVVQCCLQCRNSAVSWKQST